MKETIKLINGNNQQYTIDVPKIIILADFINDIALAHIKENTGIEFKKGTWHTYEAEPKRFEQIVALLMTYNWKTRYYNNWNYKNTLMLKDDHHTGFDVDSICYECVKHNRIQVNGLNKDSRLAC